MSEEGKKPQTELLKPPTQETQLVAPPKKRVKVKLLRDAVVDDVATTTGFDTRIAKAGEVVEVSEARAKDLLSPRKGHYAFQGERFDEVTHHSLTRAVRV